MRMTLSMYRRVIASVCCVAVLSPAPALAQSSGNAHLEDQVWNVREQIVGFAERHADPATAAHVRSMVDGAVDHSFPGARARHQPAAPGGVNFAGFHTPAAPPRMSSPGFELTYVNLASAMHVGSPGEHARIPGLSLVKMMIAHYVFAHGHAADFQKATMMLQRSDDAAASELYARYPDSIAWATRTYGLRNTHAAPHWGFSTTSTYDMAFFLASLMRENPNGPVLNALRTSAPIASDGKPQNYGTATLPRVQGTKWGWSDNHQNHSSASFGADFVVVAYSPGDAARLTALTHAALAGYHS